MRPLNKNLTTDVLLSDEKVNNLFGDIDYTEMMIERVRSVGIRPFIKDKLFELSNTDLSPEKIRNHIVPLVKLQSQFTYNKRESFTALMVMMDNITYNYDDNSRLMLLPYIINILTGKEKPRDYLKLEKFLTSNEYPVPENFVRKYVDVCDAYIKCFAKFHTPAVNGWTRRQFDLWNSIDFTMFLELADYFSTALYHNWYISIGDMMWVLETKMEDVLIKKLSDKELILSNKGIMYYPLIFLRIYYNSGNHKL